jgi:hypothetical protein
LSWVFDCPMYRCNSLCNFQSKKVKSRPMQSRGTACCAPIRLQDAPGLVDD